MEDECNRSKEAAVAANNDHGNNACKSHGSFHKCMCYGHDDTIPDYKHDVSIPRTLQGYYALQGGCPCPCVYTSTSASAAANSSSENCKTTANTLTHKSENKTLQSTSLHCPLHSQEPHHLSTYREPVGKHTIYKANDRPQENSNKVITTSNTNTNNNINRCNNNGTSNNVQGATVLTRSFPNARNYGGTAARSGVMMFTNTQSAQKKRREAKMQKLQDRIDFLRSLLHDEMCDRLQAEQLRTEIEMELKLLGSYHAQELRNNNDNVSASAESEHFSNNNNNNNNSSTTNNNNNSSRVPSVAQSHANIMDELKYVADEPLGSKENIIRLYYLLQEEEHNAALRRSGVTEEKKRETR